MNLNGSRIIITNILSAWFIFANSADPDEMLPIASFHRGFTVYQRTH